MSFSAAGDFFAESDRNEATGTNMAKKPTKKPTRTPTSTPGKTSPSKTSAYFPVQMAIQTNAELKSRFEISLSILNAGGELKLLDQSRMTGQTLFNLISLQLARSLEKKGVRAVMRELKPVMDELSAIVATEMKGRAEKSTPFICRKGSVCRSGGGKVSLGARTIQTLSEPGAWLAGVGNRSHVGPRLPPFGNDLEVAAFDVNRAYQPIVGFALGDQGGGVATTATSLCLDTRHRVQPSLFRSDQLMDCWFRRPMFPS